MWSGWAGEIGDRNVFRPAAVEAAAEYIVGQWRGFGYRVNRQEYPANGIVCANRQSGDRTARPVSDVSA